ncbi:nucleoporin Nup43 [Anthonomus grandis grandis]|uniref:nucleoporin Nup43 n=1 Tax=Anthonomus grandis grandis TaxID=2921223 RepID=UPI002165D620|nr:nucleoporin Nup43 [Anthonomus grandis grandis]
MVSESSNVTTMSHNLHGTFISEKISKIRWKPETLGESHFFITGSVDNDTNKIRLWDAYENIEEDDVYSFNVAEYPYCGDVTELKFLNSEYFASSSSSGSVHLFSVAVSDVGESYIKHHRTWKDIHYFKNSEPSPSTALTFHENDIVTVGEDGRINVLNAQSENIVRTIDNADSCSIQCVIFIRHNEVLTSNLRGQMKVWDLRSNSNKAASTFMLSGDQVTPTCLTFYPTQRHIIIAGDELGALTSWDLRVNTYPVNVLNAHEGSISEISFHPDDPDHLFTCSSAGELWHWSTKNKNKYSIDLQQEESNVWLAPENVKNKMEVLTLMPTLAKPINTLDISNCKVLCGCDNEAIYLINGVSL